MLLIAVVALSGCIGDAYVKEDGPMGRERSFRSPEEAVAIIRDLLRNEQWEEFASYYDLTGSNLDIKSLKDGSYFMNSHPDAHVHPALAGLPRRPFPPAFEYRSLEDGPDGVRVYMDICIDQGDGTFQEGVTSFFLKKTAEGFRLRPEDD